MGDLDGFQLTDLYPDEIEVYPHELEAMARHPGMSYFICGLIKDPGFCKVRPLACAEYLRVDPDLGRLVEFAEEAEVEGYEFITLYPFLAE